MEAVCSSETLAYQYSQKLRGPTIKKIKMYSLLVYPPPNCADPLTTVGEPVINCPRLSKQAHQLNSMYYVRCLPAQGLIPCSTHSGGNKCYENINRLLFTVSVFALSFSFRNFAATTVKELIYEQMSNFLKKDMKFVYD
jgi:hypothetical protein